MLKRVYAKWDNIRHQQDLRRHESTMYKRQKLDHDKSLVQEEMSTYRYRNTLGPGGALQKIQRRIYQDGLKKLQKNRWKNPAEKERWLAWCNGDGADALIPEELAMVSSDTWQYVIITYNYHIYILTFCRPISYDLPQPVGDEEDFDDDYKEGRDSEECEEEVIGDSDLEAEFELEENEYEKESSGDEESSQEETSDSASESAPSEDADDELARQ